MSLYNNNNNNNQLTALCVTINKFKSEIFFALWNYTNLIMTIFDLLSIMNRYVLINIFFSLFYCCWSFESQKKNVKEIRYRWSLCAVLFYILHYCIVVILFLFSFIFFYNRCVVVVVVITNCVIKMKKKNWVNVTWKYLLDKENDK